MGRDSDGVSRHVIETRSEHTDSSTEVRVLGNLVAAGERRMDRLEDELADKIADAVKTALNGRILSAEETQWVQLAIKRESQSIKLRQAIIEKTLTGLIWAGLGLLGLMFMDYLQAHGWKK